MDKKAKRLAALRLVRESELAERRSAQQQAQEALDVLSDQREELAEETQSLGEFRHSALTHPHVGVQQLLDAQRHAAHLTAAAAQLSHQYGQVAEEVARRQAFTIQSHQATKAVEKLHQRHTDALREEQLRQEARLLDEIAQTQFLRRSH